MTDMALAIPATVQPSLEQLLSDVTAMMQSQHTVRAYSGALRRFIQWLNGDEFNRTNVRRYVTTLRDANASSATVNLFLASIKALAREAQSHGAITETAAVSIIQVRGIARQPRRTGRWLDAEQAQRLLAAPDNLRDRAILSVLLGTALRRSEVCGLTRGQVQYLGKRRVLADVPCKRRKVRTIVMPEWTAQVVDAWLEAEYGSPEWPLFYVPWDHTRPLTAAGLVWVVDKWSRAAGCPVRVHDIRRSFTKFCLQGGADMRAIQTALGHSSVATTELYCKPLTELDNPACDKIELRLVDK